MTDDVRGSADRAPIHGAPTWLHALQAALLGLVAGLALHAVFSLVVVHGEAPGSKKNPGPSQCRKANPARDTVAPSTTPPAARSGRSPVAS